MDFEFKNLPQSRSIRRTNPADIRVSDAHDTIDVELQARHGQSPYPARLSGFNRRGDTEHVAAADIVRSRRL